MPVVGSEEKEYEGAAELPFGSRICVFKFMIGLADVPVKFILAPAVTEATYALDNKLTAPAITVNWVGLKEATPAVEVVAFTPKMVIVFPDPDVVTPLAP